MSAYPTANRHDARRAYLDALRVADGLPPFTGRPVASTTDQSVVPVSGEVTVAVGPPILRAVPAVVVS